MAPTDGWNFSTSSAGSERDTEMEAMEPATDDCSQPIRRDKNAAGSRNAVLRPVFGTALCRRMRALRSAWLDDSQSGQA